jgi:uncharacterized phiE125 gp8 family phage protein
MSIRTVTPVATIPLLFDVATARQEVRADPTGDAAEDAAEDALITAKIHAAMGYVERFASQVLTPRELEMVLGGFPCLPELISIPREPVTAITSIKYTHPTTGAETVMDVADYRWSDASPDLVQPAFRAAWPVAANERGSVRVRFAAGYEDGLAPPALVAAVKHMFVHLYENRASVDAGAAAQAVELPLGVRDLCMPYRRILI